MCQKCHNMVSQVFQKGYCKNCISDHLALYRNLMRISHASYNSQNHPIKKKIIDSLGQINMDEKSV
ncbi:MAG: hypothetical protein OEZ22_11665 [Spirochaetia bacterium]|nr:hypothetical protein [Spirochaetia bacterium]